MEDRRWLAPMLGALVLLVAAMAVAALTDAAWAQWSGFLALVCFLAFFILARHGVVWALAILGIVLTAVVAAVVIE